MALLPEFVVYTAMFYLSFMGILCSRRRIFLDPIYFLLFIPQAVLYIYFDIFDIPIAVRAPMVRMSLFIIPACFSILLTLQYWRSWGKIR